MATCLSVPTEMTKKGRCKTGSCGAGAVLDRLGSYREAAGRCRRRVDVKTHGDVEVTGVVQSPKGQRIVRV